MNLIKYSKHKLIRIKIIKIIKIIPIAINKKPINNFLQNNQLILKA